MHNLNPALAPTLNSNEISDMIGLLQVGVKIFHHDLACFFLEIFKFLIDAQILLTMTSNCTYHITIIHTRLRLNVCALNYYLFKIGSKPSPECLCGFEIESINHYFLHCPLFAAPRLKLLSSAAHILADRWNAISELQLLRLFLTGSSQLTENENIGIFHSVQCFIKESGRFALVEP